MGSFRLFLPRRPTQLNRSSEAETELDAAQEEHSEKDRTFGQGKAFERYKPEVPPGERADVLSLFGTG